VLVPAPVLVLVHGPEPEPELEPELEPEPEPARAHASAGNTVVVALSLMDVPLCQLLGFDLDLVWTPCKTPCWQPWLASDKEAGAAQGPSFVEGTVHGVVAPGFGVEAEVGLAEAGQRAVEVGVGSWQTPCYQRRPLHDAKRAKAQHAEKH
jgi:hypothetical protein